MTAEYAIIGEWLAQEVDGCTCGATTRGYGEYGHEPMCGLEPLAKIADLLAALDSDSGRAQAGKNATPYRAERVGGEPGNAAPEPATTTATPDALGRFTSTLLEVEREVMAWPLDTTSLGYNEAVGDIQRAIRRIVHAALDSDSGLGGPA